MKQKYFDKRKIGFILFSLLLLTFTSCGKNEEPRPQPPTPVKNNLVENLLVADSQINSKVVSVDDDKIVLTETPKDIKLGGYIASDMTDVAPNGYLRKVVAIRKEGGKVVLDTEQASLTEVVRSGRYVSSHKYTAKDIIFKEDDPVNQSITGFRSDDELFHFKLSKEIVIYDGDGNKKTKDDQIKLTGSCAFTIEVEDILFDFDESKYEFSLKLSNKNKFRVSAGVKLDQLLGKDLEYEHLLAKYELPPYTVMIGPLPVPIAEHRIAFYINASGNISAKIEAGVDNKSSVTAGLGYSETKKFYPIHKTSNKFTLVPFVFRGKAEAKVGLALGYEVNPYGLTSQKNRDKTRF